MDSSARNLVSSAKRRRAAGSKPTFAKHPPFRRGDARSPPSGLATPEPIKDWSLTSVKEKLIKIGARVVSHGRYVAFQLAEVAIPPNLFTDVSRMTSELRPPPVMSTA